MFWIFQFNYYYYFSWDLKKEKERNLLSTRWSTKVLQKQLLCTFQNPLRTKYPLTKYPEKERRLFLKKLHSKTTSCDPIG
jgi:hypothetical protein